MANVLNKVTKEYLRSVNTPDYDPEQWLINPEVSLLQPDSRYWVIESNTVQVGYDDILEQPIMETVFSVRDMTVEEKAVYDAANPQQANGSSLLNGMPAHVVNGKLVSVNTIEAPFFSLSKGAKNFYAMYSGVVQKFISHKRLCIVEARRSEFTGHALIQVNNASGYQLSSVVDSPMLELNPGDTVSVKIISTENVNTPLVTLTLAEID